MTMPAKCMLTTNIFIQFHTAQREKKERKKIAWHSGQMGEK